MNNPKTAIRLAKAIRPERLNRRRKWISAMIESARQRTRRCRTMLSSMISNSCCQPSDDESEQDRRHDRWNRVLDDDVLGAVGRFCQSRLKVAQRLLDLRRALIP